MHKNILHWRACFIYLFYYYYYFLTTQMMTLKRIIYDLIRYQYQCITKSMYSSVDYCSTVNNVTSLAMIQNQIQFFCMTVNTQSDLTYFAVNWVAVYTNLQLGGMDGCVHFQTIFISLRRRRRVMYKDTTSVLIQTSVNFSTFLVNSFKINIC